VRTWWPFLLGHVIEWYDFAVYGYLAHPMKENFFSGSAFATWFGFSVTFLARPLGGLVLGRVADAFGRRSATLFSIVGMLVATVGQGCLPSYACCGEAAGRFGKYALLSFRLMQGVFAGGELPAIVAYFVETAPRPSLAFATSISSAVAVLAFTLADVGTSLLVEVLGPDRMVQWGWRVPYFLPLLPGVLAFWGRLGLPETEEFLCEQRRLAGHEENALAAGPSASKPGVTKPFVQVLAFVGRLRTFCAAHGGAALVGLGGCAGFAVTFYTGLMWCPSHLRSQGLAPATAGWLGVAGNFVMIVTMFVCAHVGDSVGIGYIKLLGAAYSAVVSVLLFAVLSAHQCSTLVGFLCVSLGFGTTAGVQGSVAYLFIAELFPTAVRAMGFALSWNVALAAFGGTSALVAEALVRLSLLGPGIYMSCVNFVSFTVLLLGLSLHRRGMLQLSHLRPEPYFGKKASKCSDKCGDRDVGETSEGSSV